jgi:uncharacterized lipoprotein YmbA
VWGGSDSKQTARLTGCSAACTLASPLCFFGKARALALAVALVFSGCSALSPKQDRTRFILLAPVTPGGSNNAQPSASPKLASVAIGLGPVQFPEYLDRPELVIRTSPNGFDLSETNRWAEPLPDNFRHVLANDLTNLMGTTNIVQYPWYPETRLDYIVHVQVQRFEADTIRNAQLIARWDLRTLQSDQVLASREVRLTHPLTSLAGDAVAAALSEDVAELAGQIASTIAQVEQQSLARAPG